MASIRMDFVDRNLKYRSHTGTDVFPEIPNVHFKRFLEANNIFDSHAHIGWKLTAHGWVSNPYTVDLDYSEFNHKRLKIFLEGFLHYHVTERADYPRSLSGNLEILDVVDKGTKQSKRVSRITFAGAYPV